MGPSGELNCKRAAGLEGWINDLFSLLLILKSTLISSILGVAAAPAGKIDLPAPPALRPHRLEC